MKHLYEYIEESFVNESEILDYIGDVVDIFKDWVSSSSEAWGTVSDIKKTIEQDKKAKNATKAELIFMKLLDDKKFIRLVRKGDEVQIRLYLKKTLTPEEKKYLPELIDFIEDLQSKLN